MINERNLAEKFPSIWKQHFPLLTPGYMYEFNVLEVKPINTREVKAPGPMRYDLTTEIAFNLSALAYTRQESPAAIFQDEARQQALVTTTMQSISQFSRYLISPTPLTDVEQADILAIAENTLEFITLMGGQQLSFRPEISGYGLIPNLSADLCIGDTLFEIKTVNRNFRSSDLKQLFIYLALRQLSASEPWPRAGLYNPRKGTYCQFEVNPLITTLSNGKSAHETFENLLNDLSR
jgi:hypothetical protein